MREWYNLGSEEARTALHAIVGCAGAAASSQSCGAGAVGAASSSVLGSLLAPSRNLSASEREARDNLVTSLVAGVAAVSGQKVATATGAGTNAIGGRDDSSTFWSTTKNKTAVENAYGHSTKHGNEFPEHQNSVQYVKAAQGFVNNPPPGTLIKTRPSGDTLYYDPSTNTFASETKDGAPKTMFKPEARMDYWNRQ